MHAVQVQAHFAVKEPIWDLPQNRLVSGCGKSGVEILQECLSFVYSDNFDADFLDALHKRLSDDH